MSAFITYLISGLAVGCSFALVASGFVVIHRVTHVVNFAQGTFAVIAGMMASSLLSNGMPHGFAEVLALAAATVAGILVGAVAIGKPGTTPLISLVITLGLAIFAYALEIILWGEQPLSFRMASGTLVIAGVHILSQHLVVIAVTAVTFVALGLFFGRTYTGKALTASASNPLAARMFGIKPLVTGLIAFGLGGLLGGLAGILLTPLQPVSFNSDLSLAINGFAAAIFGGLNNPTAALGGALVLGVSQSMIAGYFSASYQTEIALIVMLVIMIWRTRGRMTVTEEIS